MRPTTLYYHILAPLMLPFAGRRILNLRCPGERCFFQRNCEHPSTGPEFDPLVHFGADRAEERAHRTLSLYRRRSGNRLLAKLATVEFHRLGSKAGTIKAPDRMVIDLDPDPDLGFSAVKSAALQLRRAFEALDFDSFALLSEGKGLQSSSRSGPKPDGNRVTTSPSGWRPLSRGPTPIASPSPSLRRSDAGGSSSTSSATIAPRPLSCLTRRASGPGCRSPGGARLDRSLGSLQHRQCRRADPALQERVARRLGRCRPVASGDRLGGNADDRWRVRYTTCHRHRKKIGLARRLRHGGPGDSPRADCKRVDSSAALRSGWRRRWRRCWSCTHITRRDHRAIRASLHCRCFWWRRWRWRWR